MNFKRRKSKWFHTRRSHESWHNLRRKHFKLREIAEKEEEKLVICYENKQINDIISSEKLR